MPHHMGHEAEGMGFMHAAMGAVSAVMFVAAVLGVLYLLNRRGVLDGLKARALGARRPALAPARRAGGSEAEAYLDMALAKGEIDVMEYHERRSALRSQF